MPESVKPAWVPYGRVLKHLRKESGLSCRDLAGLANCAESLISKLERGRRSVSVQVNSEIATVLGDRVALATERLTDAHAKAVQASKNSWHIEIADVEAEATSMQIWEPLLVPGIMQTEDYAEAVFSDGRPNEADVTQHVGTRMERALAVADKDQWVILDEMALYRDVGSPRTMADQIRHLVTVAAMRSRRVTIFPRGAPYCGGLSGSFILLSTQDRTHAYTEHTGGGEIINDPDEVDRISAVWRELSAWALSPAESAAVMEKAIRHHEKE